MARFIKLNKADEKGTIVINVNKIVSMEIVDGQTIIYTKKDFFGIAVTQTPDQIVEMNEMLDKFKDAREILNG